MPRRNGVFRDDVECQARLLKCDEVVAMEKTKIPNTKSSRRFSGKHQMVLDKVYELLECPVCTTLMSPPIHQCPNGHTLCSICKIRVQSCCPLCRCDMGSIRCLALEKVAEPLELPYECPYSGSECSVTGNIPELVTHLKDVHNVDMLYGPGFKHGYDQSHEKDNATGMLAVLNCHGRQFCYHFEEFVLGMVPCYIAFLRFMGEDAEAKKFKYSLDIGGNDRKLMWQGVPRSIRDSHQKVRDGLDGLMIPLNLALFFSDGNELELKLQVEGRIWINS